MSGEAFTPGHVAILRSIDIHLLKRSFLYRNDVTAKEMGEGLAVLKEHNNYLFQDLAQQHEANPSGVTLAIIPSQSLVVGMFGDKLRAVVVNMSCAVKAVENVMGRNAQHIKGYRIKQSTDSLGALENNIQTYYENSPNGTYIYEPFYGGANFLSMVIRGVIRDHNPLMEYSGGRWKEAAFKVHRPRFGGIRRFLGRHV